MSKFTSFYDWENFHQYKKKSTPPKISIKTKNTLDLDPGLFRSYIRYWARNNLSKQ